MLKNSTLQSIEDTVEVCQTSERLLAKIRKSGRFGTPLNVVAGLVKAVRELHREIARIYEVQFESRLDPQYLEEHDDWSEILDEMRSQAASRLRTAEKWGEAKRALEDLYNEIAPDDEQLDGPKDIDEIRAFRDDVLEAIRDLKQRDDDSAPQHVTNVRNETKRNRAVIHEGELSVFVETERAEDLPEAVKRVANSERDTDE